MFATDAVVAIRDLHPVSRGHTLVLPRRHVVTYFDASPEEQQAIWHAVAEVKRALDAEHAPDGYNVGFNAGEAAGQTVPHLHVHVIPRYRGDVDDPRGGVRGVVPGKRGYPGMPEQRGGLAGLVPPQAAEAFGIAPHHRPLVSGADSDPLLPHLRAHLDRSASFDAVVAFVLPSGFFSLETKLTDLLERGGTIRILTGDYLDATDPDALVRLVDLQDRFPDRVHLRVYEARQRSFHPKAYVLHAANGDGVAFVGSSNLSRTALAEGVEWNYRVVSTSDVGGFEAVIAEVERLWRHPSVKPLTRAWIAGYRERRPAPYSALPVRVVGVADRDAGTLSATAEMGSEQPPPEVLVPCTPTDIQREALEALALSRAEGNRAGLVVLATGLGKTFLSAFDAQATNAKRVLFVAHREEILRQAHRTFRDVLPNASLGFYMSDERMPDADVVFASVQTLSRRAHLDRFARDAFDYITIDEFHHADAPTYRTLIQYFEPEFLLGLTATPERTDGGDLLALCGENLVYRADLFDGIQRGRLSRFHYFGIPDEVKYENIPWRSGRFDTDELTQAVATEARAQNALQQLRSKGGKRALAFCVSIRHADFMRDYLLAHGIRAACVHSGSGSMPRGEAIDCLRMGRLDIVLTVDMFNEGVDIPSVDTVLMLRPTESRTLWLQQIGRGLRLAPEKDLLRIIDYVGNHRSFLGPLELLFAAHGHELDLLRTLAELRRHNGHAELPAGCEVTYDLEAIEILDALRRRSKSESAFQDWVREIQSRRQRRPTATEAFHAGHRPDKLPRRYGGWLRAMRALDALSDVEAAVLDDAHGSHYLETLTTMSMLSAGGAVAQLAWIDSGGFPSPVDERGLSEACLRVARRLGPLALGVSDFLETGRARDLARSLAEEPWSEAGVRYDSDDGGNARVSLSFDLPEPLRPAFVDLTRELVEWRLAEFLERTRRDRNAAVFRDDGKPLDAHFSTDLTERGYQILVESRGGTKGSSAERNTEYGPGLEQLLRRLAELDARLDGAWLATRESQDALTMPDFPYPVLLGRVDPKAVRAALQRAQGNNPTRRIRLVMSGLAEMTPTKLHRLLSRGPSSP